MTTVMTIAYILGGLFLVLGALMLVLFFISVKNDKKIEGGIDGMLARNENSKKKHDKQSTPSIETPSRPLPLEETPRARTQEAPVAAPPVMPVRSAEATALLQEMEKAPTSAPSLPTTTNTTPPRSTPPRSTPPRSTQPVTPVTPTRPLSEQRPHGNLPQRTITPAPRLPVTPAPQRSVPSQQPQPTPEHPVQRTVASQQSLASYGETRASRRQAPSADA